MPLSILLKDLKILGSGFSSTDRAPFDSSISELAALRTNALKHYRNKLLLLLKCLGIRFYFY